MMIEKLSPPTDNLYKFVAIFGLIGAVLSVILLVRQVGKTMDVHMQAVASYQEAWLAVGANVDARNLLNEYWKKATEEETAFGLSEELQGIQGLPEEGLAAGRAFEVSAEALVFARSINENAQQYLAYLLGGSGFLMLIGFAAWYHNTQQYQDKKLRQSCEPVEPSAGRAVAAVAMPFAVVRRRYRGRAGR